MAALSPAVLLFRGSRRECAEAGLVLEAKAIPYETVYGEEGFAVWVESGVADSAREELARYEAERRSRAAAAPRIEPFPGAAPAACAYAAVLLLVAWCAGAQLLGVDWLAAGSLDAAGGARTEPWRAVTALTLHLDQQHLLGNLLFGIAIGVLAGRMFGPGIAWLGIVLAASAANLTEMLISPPEHRAVGASTAVFAALGMLSGFAWRLRFAMTARAAYRFGPLFAGLCLLALLGAGDAHVDVLGHVLGFTAGILAGALWGGRARARGEMRSLQYGCGALALLVIVIAWSLALERARRGG